MVVVVVGIWALLARGGRGLMGIELEGRLGDVLLVCVERVVVVRGWADGCCGSQ